MGKWKWFFTDLFCYFLRFMSWESSEWPFQIEKQKNPRLALVSSLRPVLWKTLENAHQYNIRLSTATFWNLN